jgi:hypothetical protein
LAWLDPHDKREDDEIDWQRICHQAETAGENVAGSFSVA